MISSKEKNYEPEYFKFYLEQEQNTFGHKLAFHKNQNISLKNI